MDWWTGQSKKHFRTSSLLGQEQQVKEGCSSTFASPGLSSNKVLFLSLLSFLLLYIFCWCFSPSCYRRGSECWWGDSWCDSSKAAFQIISHDLNIQTVPFNTEYRSRCPYISSYFGSHWKSLRGRNILQEPWFLSLSPFLSRKVTCNHYLSSKGAHV